MEIYAVLILLAVLIVLAIVLIVKMSGKKDSGDSEKIQNLADTVSNEFERSRRENQEYQKNLRMEVNQSLRDMNSRIDQMKGDNAEKLGQLEKTVYKSLSEIRVNNAEQSQKQSETISQAVDKMRESNEKKLDEMRMTVDEKLTSTLSQRLDSSFKTVSERLENVYKSLGEMKELSNGVTANVTSLNRVLSNVKARGTWAEVQLASILDQTIPGMYETNFQPDPKSKDRVEFAVRIPNGDNNETTYLPIDSKFPMEDYVRLCDAADRADPEAVAEARKSLEIKVISEAKTITKYINIPVTTPFAIMYLATEGLYAEIAASRNGLPEKLQRDLNIMIAGPSTITALLNSLSMGFKTVAINEKANEVRLLLATAKAQYETFGNVLAKAKKKIDEAGETIDEAGKRNDIIRKKLKGVEEIEDFSPSKLLETESE